MPPELPLAISYVPSIRQLYIRPSWWKPGCFDGIISCQLPNLEVLRVSNVISGVMMAQLLRFATQCPELQNLWLEVHIFYDDRSDALSDLYVLLRALTAPDAVKLASQVPRNLLSLKLNRWDQPKFIAMPELRLAISNLTNLELDMLGQHSSQVYNPMIGKLPNVRSLRLYSDADQCLEFLLSFESLEKLDLRIKSPINTMDILYEALRNNIPTLTCLGWSVKSSLFGISTEEGEMLNRLLGQTGVEHLGISIIHVCTFL
jgi:hypothetical protein